MTFRPILIPVDEALAQMERLIEEVDANSPVHFTRDGQTVAVLLDHEHYYDLLGIIEDAAHERILEAEEASFVNTQVHRS
jgi:hypothetical protein